MASNHRIPVLESHKAPIHIRAVTLKALKLQELAAYYEVTIGLDRIRETADQITLGSGGVGYFNLVAAPDALPDQRRGAGLFHTAFLLPSRAELGSWFKAAYDHDGHFDAASDHGVSEAFYLTDPEGNGIEVYSDRARSSWQRDGEGYDMTTLQLDVPSIVEAGTQAAQLRGRVPAATRIGHVHLKVGDIAKAEAFYSGTVGLDMTHRRQGGSFFSSGGYHHHIATNTWGSAGAQPRTQETTGLERIDLTVTDEAVLAGISQRLGMPPSTEVMARDPWAIELVFKHGPAL